MQLFGEGAQQNGETNRLAVTGVPVNRAFARRHLLGGAAFESSPGAAVAHVRLHYADGATDDLPIVQGADVRSCWGLRHQAEPAFTDANTRGVWRAPHAAAAKIPLLHVYGDADEAVPWDENTGVIAERYRQLGGSITLLAKPGGKHHPHGLTDSTPIVDFLWDNTASAEAKAWFARHGGGTSDAK